MFETILSCDFNCNFDLDIDVDNVDVDVVVDVDDVIIACFLSSLGLSNPMADSTPWP